jgi:uncharacterized protein YrzB (UPF0473 family)
MYEKDYTGDEVELHIVIFKDEQLYSIEDEKEWDYVTEAVNTFLHK